MRNSNWFNTKSYIKLGQSLPGCLDWRSYIK